MASGNTFSWREWIFEFILDVVGFTVGKDLAQKIFSSLKGKRSEPASGASTPSAAGIPSGPTELGGIAGFFYRRRQGREIGAAKRKALFRFLMLGDESGLKEGEKASIGFGKGTAILVPFSRTEFANLIKFIEEVIRGEIPGMIEDDISRCLIDATIDTVPDEKADGGKKPIILPAARKLLTDLDTLASYKDSNEKPDRSKLLAYLYTLEEDGLEQKVGSVIQGFTDLVYEAYTKLPAVWRKGLLVPKPERPRNHGPLRIRTALLDLFDTLALLFVPAGELVEQGKKAYRKIELGMRIGLIGIVAIPIILLYAAVVFGQWDVVGSFIGDFFYAPSITVWLHECGALLQALIAVGLPFVAALVVYLWKPVLVALIARFVKEGRTAIKIVNSIILGLMVTGIASYFIPFHRDLPITVITFGIGVALLFAYGSYQSEKSKLLPMVRSSLWVALFLAIASFFLGGSRVIKAKACQFFTWSVAQVENKFEEMKRHDEVIKLVRERAEPVACVSAVYCAPQVPVCVKPQVLLCHSDAFSQPFVVHLPAGQWSDEISLGVGPFDIKGGVKGQFIDMVYNDGTVQHSRNGYKDNLAPRCGIRPDGSETELKVRLYSQFGDCATITRTAPCSGPKIVLENCSRDS